MASFRTGFKIFGELAIKQGLGRIRSFSEDRNSKPWLPEDQWAVRQPGSTCPDPCAKPKKQPKPSKSWLSICKDPEPPIPCDVRHNNCPPPPVKDNTPWYSLNNFITKKKTEKPPPVQCCREEMKRRDMEKKKEDKKEEVCENLVHNESPEPKIPMCGMSKKEISPAPVIDLPCPPPKELDIMLWCGRPRLSTTRIALSCLTDKLPYQEFKPKKVWKPPPFSLPVKSELPACKYTAKKESVDFSEFKQVELPKPLYTRYKSVDLSSCGSQLLMVEAKCPYDEAPITCSSKPSLPIPSVPLLPSFDPKKVVPNVEKKEDGCADKPVIEAASCKPVRIKKAPKYTFQPKPTKLIEKRKFRNPCAQQKTCNLKCSPEEETESKSAYPSQCEPPKTITGTLTDEPSSFERNPFTSNGPPKWMYFLSKPGCEKTPLVPNVNEFPTEPDCRCETDGLNFYDSNNEGLIPKPPPDPYVCEIYSKSCSKAPARSSVKCEDKTESKTKSRFVLMPDSYNIRPWRTKAKGQTKNDTDLTFDEIVEAKTASSKNSSKSHPAMKENILYDLQRACPLPPFDPSTISAPCRKPPKIECIPENTRSFSTFNKLPFDTLNSEWPCNVQKRTECGDTTGKCKTPTLVPTSKPCPEEKPRMKNCAEIRLPCCPKAKIPPVCDERKPPAICKKRLAPRPSFSECAKEPLPCPKLTECNCWEKSKNKKFSNWAAKRPDFDLKESLEPPPKDLTNKNEKTCQH